jgi:hypothetical protein
MVCVDHGPFEKMENYSNVQETSFMTCLGDGTTYLKTNGRNTESAADVGNSKGGYMDIVRFIFSSFWVWLGSVIIIYIPFNSVVFIVRAMVRGWMVKKQGWPPAHLDANGEWKEEKSHS